MTIQPKLDLVVLQECGRKLRSLLEAHASNKPDARTCLRELTPLFQQVDAGKIAAPWNEAAPCGYYFHEGRLREYPALEDAYAKFSMALQGWDDDALKTLLARAKRA